MNPNDPNLPLLESVVRDLGELLERFVFVGGCGTGLLVTDVAAAPVRVTQDVDVIAEVLTLIDYYALERELEGEVCSVLTQTDFALDTVVEFAFAQFAENEHWLRRAVRDSAPSKVALKMRRPRSL